MITYKNKGIYFGGVFDDEGPRHTIQSSFYNDLYAFDFERKRWYELGVKHASALTAGGKKKRRKQKEKSEEEGGEESSGDEEEGEEDGDGEDGELERQEQLLQAQQENLFGYIDDSGNIVYVNIDDAVEGDEDYETPVAPPVAPASVSSAPVEDGWINISPDPAPSIPLADSMTLLSDPPMTAMATATEEDEAVLIDHLTISSLPSPPPHTSSAASASASLRSQSELLRSAFLEEDLLEATAAAGGVAARGEGDSMLQLSPTPSNPLIQFFNNYHSTPVGRINCQLVTKGCSLFIYGGVTEFGDVEITLDDCWSLDLNKRDKWRSVLRGTMTELVWKGNDGDDQSERTGDGDSDSDGEDDDEDDDEESDEEDDQEQQEQESGKSKKSKGKKSSTKRREEDDQGAGEGAGEGEGEEENEKTKKSGKKKSKSSRAGIRGEMDEVRSQLPGGGEDANRIPLTGAALAAVAVSSHKATGAAAGKKHVSATAAPGPDVESLRDFYRSVVCSPSCCPLSVLPDAHLLPGLLPF
jgi:hypothetical protein